MVPAALEVLAATEALEERPRRQEGPVSVEQSRTGLLPTVSVCYGALSLKLERYH